MNRSRAAVFDGRAGQLELRDLTTPSPETGEMLVRILGCTLCMSDLHSFHGRRQVPVPTVLGHEIVGEIEAFGEEAPQTDWSGRPLKIGSRVVWSVVASCGDCTPCRRGLPQKCLRAVKYGHEAFRPGRELLGGLADRCLLVPGTAVFAAPESLSLSTLCPVSCATATIAAALAKCGDLSGRSVLVCGVGQLGVTAIAMAASRGATTVIAMDVEESRRELAKKFGAAATASPETIADVVREQTNGQGVDVVLELSGVTAAFETAYPLIQTGGTMVLVGSVFPGPPVSLLLEQIVRRHLTVCGVHNYAPADLQTAITFLTEYGEKFPFADLVSGWYPLDQINQAFEQAADRRHLRIGVQP